MQVAFEGLLGRFPDLDLAVPAGEILWSESTFMRSVEALPITLR